MTDDDFDDLLDEVVYYHPLIARDQFAKAEYDRAVAKVVNTGGEEQRALLQETIAELNNPTETRDDSDE